MVQRFFEQIEKLSGKLFLFTFKIVKNKDDALDIVQDTFVRIFNLLKREPKELSDGYIFKTAYNLAINMHTKQKRTKTLQETNKSGTESSPLESLMQAEDKHILTGAINKLSDKQREVIIFRFYLGYTFDEIAQEMSIAAGSVKVHFARGLANLRKYLPSEERI